MKPSANRAFTLIELLVVILIILIVSAVALPTVLPALQHRQVSEAARTLQGALIGARDSAIKNNRPSGIRLLPDPVLNGINPNSNLFDATQPLAYNRIIPIAAAPDYSEGVVSIYSPADSLYTASLKTVNGYSGVPCLVVEEMAVTATTPAIPNSPTSWYWNVRVGDRIQINNTGGWYTIVGPMAIPAQGATINKVFYANNELFVNVGPPGTSPPTLHQGVATEYLLLVNGQDDNNNGWIDEGFDGVDNNLAYELANKLTPLTDDALEWEQEVYLGSLFGQTSGTPYSYTIRRRPAPTGNAREVLLPTNVVVDATTWFTTLERSRLPVNPYTGYVDVLVNPTGTVVPTTIYSVPSAVGMAGSFLHFWLGERSDVYAPSTLYAPPAPGPPPYLPVGVIQPQLLATPYKLPQLQGEYRLLTLFTRTGQITTSDNVMFDNPAYPANQNTTPPTYNPSYPFLQAQQGIRGGR